MIENIKTIARILKKNNASVNTPYTAEKAAFNVCFTGDGEIWIYADTLWKYGSKKRGEKLKQAFHAKEVHYVERMEDRPFWAILLGEMRQKL